MKKLKSLSLIIVISVLMIFGSCKKQEVYHKNWTCDMSTTSSYGGKTSTSHYITTFNDYTQQEIDKLCKDSQSSYTSGDYRSTTSMSCVVVK